MSTSRAAMMCGLFCLWATVGAAQELSPRSFWPAPKGTKVAIVGYSYSTGDVLMDPSLPIYGVDSKIGTAFLGYLQTFSLWGRTTSVVLELPYSVGTTEGLLFEDRARRDFAGFGDLGITLAVNLLGAPTMTIAQFQELRANPRSVFGASLKVLAPTGHYDKGKLINVGANRWVARVELGYMIPIRPKWLLEFETGVWFFGDDDDFVQGKREQEPIFSGEIHLVKRFKPGFWASLDFNYFQGGRQTIGGERLADVQRNSRVGGTIVVPFHGRHAVKVGYSNGVVTDFGTDFKQFLVSYQVLL